MLIPEYKQCWRWYSMHAAAAQGVIAALQTAFAVNGRELLTPKHFSLLMIGFAMVIPLLRILKQDKDEST